jgi:hypothetical protein
MCDWGVTSVVDSVVLVKLYSSVYSLYKTARICNA